MGIRSPKARRRQIVPNVWLLVCLLLLSCAQTVIAPPAFAPKRVLILYWDNKDFPGNVKFDESFKRVLLSSKTGDVEYYPEYMETTRFPSQDQGFFHDYLRQKYAGRPIDVVIATADIPLDFLIQYRSELFPDSPIVFVANNWPAPEKLASGAGMTGIVNQSTYRATLDLALKLHPDTKQVFVISGSHEHDKRFENIARQELSSFVDHVELIYLTDLSLSELTSRLANAPANSIALYVWQQSIDERGKLLETYQVLARISPSSAVPIYGMGSGNLGSGIVGGYLQGPDNNGAKAAQLAMQILSGTRARDIPVAAAPRVPMFDWRQLKRWGIKERELPPNSVIQFRQFSAWEQYKWYFLTLIAAVIIEGLLIASLLVARRRRRQAEEEGKRLAQMAEAGLRHLNEVVSNVPGLVWEALLEPGTTLRKTTFISDYVETMLGYTPEEWLAQPPGFGLRLMPDAEDREKSIRESEAVIATGQQGFSQCRWQAKDGRILWVESYLAPTLDQKGKVVGLRGVTLDVTARKQAEEAAAQAEERDRAIVSAIPDLMFLQTRDGVYLDYHTKDSEELLLPPNEYLGKNMSEILPPELAAQFAICFERVEEMGEPQMLEYQLTINGTEHWFEARMVGSGENILSVVRDITDRKRALDELRLSEERFGKAFRANPQPMSITTVSDGRYLDVNDSFLTMSGYTRDEVIGHTSLELHVWEAPESRQDFVRQFIERGSVVNVETRFRTKSGATRILLSSAESLEIAGQKCLLMASSDITERKEAEEALRTANEELSRLKNQLQEENIYLQEEIKLEQNFDDIIGESDALKYVLFKIEQVAPTDSTVLISGETGTGKELVARAIHSASSRRERPLVKVNCAALSASLIESELFGHEKGAFTGAAARKIGRFELANGATIFLDEIGELPPELQVKLLRVIQEGEFERLGSSRTINVDVRIIAATNRKLDQEVQEGKFREDLWYRLNVFPITVPPLRQRQEDIPLLVEHFAGRFAKKFGKMFNSISPATLKSLRQYSWPGNVRELANVLERAAINSHGPVLRVGQDFETVLAETSSSSTMTLDEMERIYIIRVLEDRGWRIEGRLGAARLLGLNPSTLRTRMMKLGIHKPQSFSQPAS